MRVMPDGCIDVIWRSDSAALVAGPGHRSGARPVVAGFRFPSGRASVHGAGGPALAQPSHELCDLRVDLGELLQALSATSSISKLAPEAASVQAGPRLRASSPPPAAADPLVVAASRRLRRPARPVGSGWQRICS